MGVLIGLLAMMAVIFWVITPWPENLWGVGMIALVGGILGMARWMGKDWAERDRWREIDKKVPQRRPARRPRGHLDG